MLGKFITVEGPDGAGKSTNISLLARTLEEAGMEVVLSREPGGTPNGEKIRSLILTTGDMNPTCELLLFAASRAEHLHTKIMPALAAGKVVVCDRFADSSYAYQGVGRGRISEVLELERFVLNGFEPDHTLFFDITLEESVRRLGLRSDESNHFDEAAADFKKRVYNGYHIRLNECPHRMVVIDAMQTPDLVAADVRQWAQTVFIPNNPGLQRR